MRLAQGYDEMFVFECGICLLVIRLIAKGALYEGGFDGDDNWSGFVVGDRGWLVMLFGWLLLVYGGGKDDDRFLEGMEGAVI